MSSIMPYVNLQKCIAIAGIGAVFLATTLRMDSSHFNGFDEEPHIYDQLLNRLYFVATTLSTVGYGDISPKSADAKIVSIIAMVCLIVVTAS